MSLGKNLNATIVTSKAITSPSSTHFRHLNRRSAAGFLMTGIFNFTSENFFILLIKDKKFNTKFQVFL
jgi:hypothetical protein